MELIYLFLLTLIINWLVCPVPLCLINSISDKSLDNNSLFEVTPVKFLIKLPIEDNLFSLLGLVIL